MADMNTGTFKHDITEPPKSNLVLPLFSLKGKTAIVSGAGAGIGLSIAHAFGMNDTPYLAVHVSISAFMFPMLFYLWY